MVFALLGLVNTQWVSAQNVTISPQNGSMICALTEGSPTTQLGFQMGAFGTWRHNQLSLTMTGSNYTTLTEDGQLAQHSNHFITGDKCTFSGTDNTRTPSRYICNAWGTNGNTNQPGYITISLPKGYRFTSYTFHLSQDVNTFGSNSGSSTDFSITQNRSVTITENDPNGDSDNKFTGNKNRASISYGTDVVEFTRTGDDMGNVLYFTTSAGRGGFYALTFRYVELRFTADADSPIGILPSSQVSDGHSLIEVPFNTGKVDLGEITQGKYQGATRISYQYNTVTDMSANMLLYEFESTQNGTALDGTSGLVAYNKKGSITTSGEYFKFAPSSDKAEQRYVLETPVSATMSNNTENPVQFRITEATINYSGESSNTFHITFTDDSGTKYYLGTNGRFSTTEQTVWSIDEDGHIKSGTNYLYGRDGDVSTTTSSYYATTYSISDDGVIRYQRYDGTYRYLKAYANYTNQGSWLNPNYVLAYYSGNMTTSSGNDYVTAATEDIQDEAHTGAELYIYDKEGNSKETIQISGKGSKPLYDLNNDAIIIGVKGGKVALVNFELKLQALNPYIDQMSVVMNDTDNGKNLRMTQTFTSDDFSVGGDKFVFYLPSDCKGDNISMTFEDLYSKYGDETYNHTGVVGDNHSRYNFVMSQHNIAFTDDNIYNAKSEAASSTLESKRIEDDTMVRTKVGTVGDTPFRFNNADVLSTTPGHLTEYPFTLYNYAHQTNGASGNFVASEFENVGENGTATDKDIFYVFTTDETRYNIAPTTATQHRSYAFYAMEVELICRDYDPIVEFVPVYDSSFNETSNTEFFGVKVSAPAEVTTPLASDLAVHKAIVEKIKEGKPSATDNEVQAELKKILYLDMSKLKGVYHSTAIGDEDKPYEVPNFDELRKKLAPNALVFLPVNATSTFNNFAYAKKGEVAGSFQSSNNIVLTDKNPFYSPYTIQVDAANYAIYTRKVTKNTYDEVQYATVFMPFTIELDADGQHKSEVKNKDGVIDYGTTKFLQMNGSNATSNNKFDYLGEVDADKAFFTKTSDSQVEANTPYALQIVDKGRSGDSFTLVQYGSNIAATPKTDNLFSATEISSTGKLTDKYGVAANYTFSHVGTFSGAQVAKEQKLFYFANNGFYSSVELKDSYKTVDIYPFRSVYQASGTGSAKVGYLMLVEGENPNTATGITEVDKVFTGVTTGNGYITITSDADTTYRIRSVSGQNVDALNLKAGETQTVNVPAGIYLVNGLKVLVK